MSPAETDTHNGSSTLLQTALAFRDPIGRWKCLSPIREYIELYMHCGLNVIEPLLTFHGKLAKHAQEAVCTAERPVLLKRIIPEIGNIQSAITISMGVPEILEQAINALWCGSTFFLSAGPSLSMMITLLSKAINVAREKHVPLPEARCLVA